MRVNSSTTDHTLAQELSIDLLVELMSSVGIDGNIQRTRDEAQAIFTTVRRTLRGNEKPRRSSAFSGFGWKDSSTSFRVFPIGRYVVCGLFGLIWIGGAARLWRRCRPSASESSTTSVATCE